jgi:hypothetical protein
MPDVMFCDMGVCSDSSTGDVDRLLTTLSKTSPSERELVTRLNPYGARIYEFSEADM